MKIKILALTAAFVVIGFSGFFIFWAVLGPSATVYSSNEAGAASASVAEPLSDGRLDVRVAAVGDRVVRLEIQFLPTANEFEWARGAPDANFSMPGMRMDSFDPPLQIVDVGEWRAVFKVPMAGTWVASVGFGEERAEIEFYVR